MSALPDELRVLLLPSAAGELLLPAAAVAEIVRVERPAAAAGEGGGEPEGEPRSEPIELAPCRLADLDWRGQRVPQMRLAAPTDTPRGRGHAVVCFAPSADSRLPFLAIECRGLPHLERARPGFLLANPDAHASIPSFVSHALTLNGRPAWLVDLDALEAELLPGA